MNGSPRLRYIFFCLALTGCSSPPLQKGRLITKEDFQFLDQGMGKLTIDQTKEKVGPPSCVLSFDPLTLYYLNVTMHHSPFSPPSIDRNKSVALIFSTEGRLSKIIHNTDIVQGAFQYHSKETPLPSTHRETFLKNLFKNAGRFTKNPKKTP